MDKLNRIEICLIELKNISKEQEWVKENSFTRFANGEQLRKARVAQLTSRTNEVVNELRIIMGLSENANIGQIFAATENYLNTRHERANQNNKHIDKLMG